MFLQKVGGFLKGYTASNLKTVFFKFTAVRSPNLYLQQSKLSKILKKTKLKDDMSDVAPVT